MLSGHEWFLFYTEETSTANSTIIDSVKKTAVDLIYVILLALFGFGGLGDTLGNTLQTFS